MLCAPAWAVRKRVSRTGVQINTNQYFAHQNPIKQACTANTCTAKLFHVHKQLPCVLTTHETRTHTHPHLHTCSSTGDVNPSPQTPAAAVPAMPLAPLPPLSKSKLLHCPTYHARMHTHTQCLPLPNPHLLQPRLPCRCCPPQASYHAVPLTGAHPVPGGRWRSPGPLRRACWTGARLHSQMQVCTEPTQACTLEHVGQGLAGET